MTTHGHLASHMVLGKCMGTSFFPLQSDGFELNDFLVPSSAMSL